MQSTSRFFTYQIFIYRNYSEPDGELTLWLLPVIPAKGLFLRPCQPSDFHKDTIKAKFGFRLSNVGMPSLPFTNDAFPILFDWADGRFEMHEKRIPHFSTWWSILTRPAATAVTSPRPAFVPPKLTYDEASPQKKRRAMGDAMSSSDVFTLDEE